MISMHHGNVNVCIKHRWVSHWDACPTCGNVDRIFHSKWRAPKKTNDLAWKRIANGERDWDRKAVSKKSRRWNERMDLYWELLKRRNPKANPKFGSVRK
jgi:hypothetical protein